MFDNQLQGMLELHCKDTTYRSSVKYLCIELHRPEKVPKPKRPRCPSFGGFGTRRPHVWPVPGSKMLGVGPKRLFL